MAESPKKPPRAFVSHSGLNTTTLIVAIVVLAVFVVGITVFAVRSASSVSGSSVELKPAAENVAATSTNTNNAAQSGTNQATVATNPDYTLNVHELLQEEVMPSGCEVVSLTCVLNALGFDIAPDSLEQGYLVYAEDETDVGGYFGDPYFDGYCFPPCLVTTANGYLAAQGAEGSKFAAQELSGVSLDSLLTDYVDKGWPVLVWTTMYSAPVVFSGLAIGDYDFYYNLHCVVLFGENADGVEVMDPINGIITRDKAVFEEIYNDCGMHAVVITAS
ncbi:MAG: C39 family peptidase [Coriobacteriia bacterium]|nr:C39 family peptidase [Coriobacteriia bacterium]